MSGKKASVYMPKQHKLGIIQKMHEYKHVLFSHLNDNTDSVTRLDKARAWSEIYDHSVLAQLWPKDRDCDFLRNTFWHNAKGSSLVFIFI